jgi:hypothetical protein
MPVEVASRPESIAQETTTSAETPAYDSITYDQIEDRHMNGATAQTSHGEWLLLLSMRDVRKLETKRTQLWYRAHSKTVERIVHFGIVRRLVSECASN